MSAATPEDAALDHENDRLLLDGDLGAGGRLHDRRRRDVDAGNRPRDRGTERIFAFRRGASDHHEDDGDNARQHNSSKHEQPCFFWIGRRTCACARLHNVAIGSKKPEV
jgi:hypothetical protein